MKKMNVYVAPKAEVIEMNLEAVVLSGSMQEVTLEGDPAYNDGNFKF